MENKDQKIDLYQFNRTEWIKTESLTQEKIIIGVVKAENKLIYWEGSKTHAQDQEKAKQNLVGYKNRYSKYQFVHLRSFNLPNSQISAEVLEFLNAHFQN